MKEDEIRIVLCISCLSVVVFYHTDFLVCLLYFLEVIQKLVLFFLI